jgi:glycosyltransferase involved in cell wall biosynthesis
MAALAACSPEIPLVVSIWGNDLTLHAPTNRLIGRATRRVLARTDLLFADCQRDLDMASEWGLRAGIPTAIFPGGGGIDLAYINRAHRMSLAQIEHLTGSDCRLIVNSRGCREYVRNDTLLQALSILAGSLDPRVYVVLVDVEHDDALRREISRHALAEKIILIGKLSPHEMLSLFSSADISVSITEHDGTPNTLLEAMAVGAIPVCSNLPSIREWVEPGHNGFLAAFDDPQAVADAIRLALGLSDAERLVLEERNRLAVRTRAARSSTGKQAAEKYLHLVAASSRMATPSDEAAT